MGVQRIYTGTEWKVFQTGRSNAQIHTGTAWTTLEPTVGAVPVVASTSSASIATAGSSLPMTIPTGTVAGNTLILAVACRNTTVVFDALAGWSTLLTISSGQNVSMLWLVRTATGSDPNPTVTWTSATTRAVGRIFRVTGVGGYDGSQFVKATSTAVQTIPAATTNGPNRLLLAVGVSARGDTTLTLDPLMTAGPLVTSGGTTSSDIQMLYALETFGEINAEASTGTRTVQANGTTAGGVWGVLLPIAPTLT